MPIKHKKLPKGLKNIIKLATEDIGELVDIVGDAFNSIIGDHDDNLPHPFYTIPLEDIKSGKSLEDAEVTGWRIMNEVDGKEYALDYHSKEGAEDDHELHAKREGGHFSTIRKVLKTLTLADEYTVAALEIPALYIHAIWLHPEKEKVPGLVVALDPAPDYLKVNHIYQQAKFEEIIAENAKVEAVPFDLSNEPEETGILDQVVEKTFDQLENDNGIDEGEDGAPAAEERPALIVDGKQNKLQGRLLNKDGSSAVGYSIAVFDHDFLQKPDALGTTSSNADGSFDLSFHQDDFQDFIFDKKPDVFFIVTGPDGEVLNTKKDVIRNMDEDTPPITLTLP